MRHKWDRSNQKKGYYTCLNCGCVKEKHYPFYMYFVEYFPKEEQVFLNSPDCDAVKNKTIKPKK